MQAMMMSNPDFMQVRCVGGSWQLASRPVGLGGGRGGGVGGAACSPRLRAGGRGLLVGAVGSQPGGQRVLGPLAKLAAPPASGAAPRAGCGPSLAPRRLTPPLARAGHDEAAAERRAAAGARARWEGPWHDPPATGRTPRAARQARARRPALRGAHPTPCSARPLPSVLPRSWRWARSSTSFSPASSWGASRSRCPPSSRSCCRWASSA